MKRAVGLPVLEWMWLQLLQDERSIREYGTRYTGGMLSFCIYKGTTRGVHKYPRHTEEPIFLQLAGNEEAKAFLQADIQSNINIIISES